LQVSGGSFIPPFGNALPITLADVSGAKIRFDGLIMGEGMTELLDIEVIDGHSFGAYKEGLYEVLINETAAKKHNVKATFFMINRNMKDYPEQVKNIVDNGHTPGFHSITHDIHKLYKSPNHTVEEFDTCKETLYNITGVNSSIIRLPYGSKPYMPNDSYKALIESKYKIWDWNVDTEDWKGSSQQIINNVKTHSKGKDEIVLLTHEKDQTVQSLDQMIIYLKNNGYVFMKINEKDTPQNYWLNSFKNN
jgi:peptidoglycan/xylan/chitin deacetylase (PgdA/CDA1 family)